MSRIVAKASSAGGDEDPEIVGVVDNPGLRLGLMPEGLPTQHETSHVQVRQQG